MAGIGGEAAFGPADRAAIDRLIGIKPTSERPAPFLDERGRLTWLALPTGDQTAVLDALELRNPLPVTARLGLAAAHDRTDDPWSDRRHEDSAVYVSPVLAGWILVIGIEPGVAELSRRFGQAHRYHYDGYHGTSAWTIYVNGELVRDYGPYTDVGPRLPVEQGRWLDGVDPDEMMYGDDAVPGLLECTALTVADAMSISPASLGPDTPGSGTGVLARTGTLS